MHPFKPFHRVATWTYWGFLTFFFLNYNTAKVQMTPRDNSCLNRLWLQLQLQVLWDTAVSFVDSGIFAHFSWQNWLGSVRTEGYRWWTAIFKTCYKVLNHTSVALAVFSAFFFVLESEPPLQSLADWNRFSSRITMYLSPSILPSTLD